MDKLTAKQEAFLALMAKDSEHARRGFELLLKRTDFDTYFDALIERNFFNPVHNPSPVAVEKPGHVRVPYWDAMGYLEALAKRSGEEKDLALSRKILEVVRPIGAWREPDGSPRDNYRTFHAMAEILGAVEVEALDPADIDSIATLLSSRFDRSTTGRSLLTHLIPSLLSASGDRATELALRALRLCTAFTWTDRPGTAVGRKKAATLIDDYWMNDFVEKRAREIGQRLGRPGVEIFLDRVRELFDEGYPSSSWLGRPAVETHSQNFEWNGAENCFVEGLRESLLGWVDREADEARQIVRAMIRSDVEMVRRVGIFALGARWAQLREIYLEVLDIDLLQVGHLHELYGLLQNRFADFDAAQKSATLTVVETLSANAKDADDRRRRIHFKRQVLSAVVGKGLAAADALYAGIEADPAIGPLSSHPDFISYMEVWSGFGSTPYNAAELVALLGEGKLVQTLNEFQPVGEWRGPTVRGLTDALEQAVLANPRGFVERLNDVLAAKRPYQYAVINGFKRACEAPDGDAKVDWNDTWPRLISTFEAIVLPEYFWNEAADTSDPTTPNKEWIAPIIADFIRSASKDDTRSFPEELIERTLNLLANLLDRVTGAKEYSAEDPLGQAINTGKGRVLEALLILILRACRVADASSGGHAAVWQKVSATFNGEIALCKGANFEFSSIVAMYIANVEYMSSAWLADNLPRLFPAEYQENFICALEGLAYAPTVRSVDRMLRDQGVVDRGLRLESSGRFGRQKLLERVALGYIWGDDDLTSSRFAYMFQENRRDDLATVIGFFWNISNQKLAEPQVERVLQFFARCIAWVNLDAKERGPLLADLSHLACYIDNLTERNIELLEQVAPFAVDVTGSNDFFKELLNVVEQNPSRIAAIARVALDRGFPYFDFDGTLLKLLQTLEKCGQRPAVIDLANRLRSIREIQDFYYSLKPG